jgi:adenine-specific DNA-methyltransferase
MTNKVNTTSKDIFLTELEKFKQIFPQFVQENQINFDALKEFLDKKELKKDKEDSYQFSWAGKKEAFKAIQRPSNATLNPNKDESINFDNTSNLFIEGDNLEVLKLLQQQYFNKIKMIYIDPPYNTGKDFIYKDNFTENKNDYFERIGATKDGITLETNADSNGRFHSHWLSMMYPRLFLAKQLLTDDGVIFISIDDNEQHHLKMLCNEVFGEENFVENLIWKSKSGGANDSKFFATDHEYILCYAKNSNEFNLKIDTDAEVTTSYNLEDENGKYTLDRLDKQSLGYLESLDFSITAPDGKIYNVIHKNSNQKVARWRWGKKTVEERYDELVFKDGFVYTKNYQKEGSNPRSLLADERFGRTRTGKTGLAELFDIKNLFDNPKPPKLVKHLLNISMNENDIILDFFAGSATTGHAVMDLNKSDNGSRKFILVQIPEVTDEKSEAFKAGYKNIAQISKERLRRAITQNEYKEGFKVFELSPSNYNTPPVYNGDDENEVLKNEQYILDNPLIENYTAENLLYEIILKQGLSLHSTITLQDEFYKVYDTEREQTMYITLTNKIIDENIDNLNLTPDDILVCFDTALNDTQKVNLNRNVNLLVI